MCLLEIEIPKGVKLDTKMDTKLAHRILEHLPTRLNAVMGLPTGTTVPWNSLVTYFGHVDDPVKKAQSMAEKISQVPIAVSYLEVKPLNTTGYSLCLYVVYA